ncbi:hypothetical protein M5X00_17570 [Paenibacillus alvei]|uniref:Uncharacterized protein n=2 Tax=Paenibacillus alvei TaxID=44250 RepID=A0ABT4GZM6_PAEAL|nr:hypothetical protein [Paenibacillus alvei]EJW14276.1 hypothetical protein PAV_15c00650 [Paenibacillus alvei DSM 29]EJW19133.1 hypothetical protein PAV_1c01040 [Paenibacillus alvei DSM 29]MCY9539240.1 hypothetical protein [Paenibacillus alvei]MCY9732265.1 hypothetical protein [Paenibacillus alvei]MCY9756049.1 hypothetical protein [Paenibacillus alvei]
MKIGRRIFYDIVTGEKLVDTGERSGDVFVTTIEHDIKVYTALSERNREFFDYIELEYKQYAKDFAVSNGYRVNPITKEIEFSYPDPNQPEPEKPTYQKPLSEEVDELKQSVAELTIMIAPPQ